MESPVQSEHDRRGLASTIEYAQRGEDEEGGLGVLGKAEDQVNGEAVDDGTGGRPDAPPPASLGTQAVGHQED